MESLGILAELYGVSISSLMGETVPKEVEIGRRIGELRAEYRTMVEDMVDRFEKINGGQT